jgi:hypothetical protein
MVEEGCSGLSQKVNAKGLISQAFADNFTLRAINLA